MKRCDRPSLQHLPLCSLCVLELLPCHLENFRRWWPASNPSSRACSLRARVAQSTATLHIELQRGLTSESEAFARLGELLRRM